MPKKPKTRARNEDAFLNDNDRLNRSLLEKARKHGPVPQVTVSVAVLLRAKGGPAVVHYAAEFGDGDGISQMVEFALECTEAKLLRKGERMVVVTRDFKLGSVSG